MKTNIVSLFNEDTPGRLRHTFVKFQSQLKELEEFNGIVFIQECVRDGLVVATQNKSHTFENKTPGVKESFIETFLPPQQWCQYEDTSYLVFKKPSRQWRRSFCAATHGIAHVSSLIPGIRASRGAPGFTKNHTQIITDMLNTKPTSFKDACDKINEGKASSVVLNNNFCLDAAGNIFYTDHIVGKATLNRQIYKVNSLFAEELRDLTKGCGFKDISK